MKQLVFLFFLALSSCSQVEKRESFESPLLKETSTKLSLNDKPSNKLTIIFTNNINGETHPCGCRHFPLGGLDNVHGAIKKKEKKSQVIFLDTGDTFFKANFVPNDMKLSSEFNARNLNKGLEKVGLQFKVLGDQDLAMGYDFVKDLINNSSYTLLNSNFSKEVKIKHKRSHKINFGPHKIFLIGVVSPDTIQPKYQYLFTDPYQSLEEEIKNLKKKGYDKKNKFHHLIVLSHSGMKTDEKYAKRFSEINWILGSHSQNFNQRPHQINNTRLAQMLSRNHYLGKLMFSKEISTVKYGHIEVNQNWSKNVSPNSLTLFINDHKKQLEKLQKKEQQSIHPSFVSQEDIKYPTATSCMDCHDSQGEFWQGTAHSLAYMTLVNNGHKHDLACLKCHSLGAGETEGFKNSSDIVLFLDKNSKKDYWKEVFSKIKITDPIRELSQSATTEHAQNWYNLDLAHNATSNFANVQCLNCHSQGHNHIEDPKRGTANIKDQISKKCLSCHDSDQSNHWYQNNKLKKKVFEAHYQALSCPKIID